MSHHFQGAGHIPANGSTRSSDEHSPSINDSGSQDHIILLAAYKEFDSYLKEKGIEKPVVVLLDGHASHFDADVLSYLRNAK